MNRIYLGAFIKQDIFLVSTLKVMKRLPNECLIEIFSYLYPYLLAKLAPHSHLYNNALLYTTRSNWNALTAFEEFLGVQLSRQTKCFLAHWNQSFPIFQRCFTVGSKYGYGKDGYAIRELQVPGQNPENDQYSSADFICIAVSEIRSVHKDWDVCLCTYIDVHGFVPTINADGSKGPGIPGSIIEIEIPDRDLIQQISLEIKEELTSYPRGSTHYCGNGYSRDGLGTVAPDLLSLLKMMREDRFYYEDEQSSLPVMWRYCNGAKSFIPSRNFSLDPDKAQAYKAIADNPDSLCLLNCYGNDCYAEAEVPWQRNRFLSSDRN